jgi:SAM-dependent methyltransferase
MAPNSGSSLHVNHSFLIDQAIRLRPNGTYLDFGCGTANTVNHGRQNGLDIWGVDNFSLNAPVSDDKVKTSDGTRTPFPDSMFDVIFSNMVFEHVMKPAETLAELRRILRPDGVMLHLWPSDEVLFEGHCRVFFAHKLRSRAYLLACHRLGIGVWRKGKTAAQWADGWIQYFQASCNYLPERELHQLFQRAGFEIEHLEHEYVRYRFGWDFPFSHRLLKRLMTMAVKVQPAKNPGRLAEQGAWSAASPGSSAGADAQNGGIPER